MCFLLFSGQPAAQLCTGAWCAGAAYGLLKLHRPTGHTHPPQKSSPAGALALGTDELGKAPSGTGLEGLPEGHGQGPNEEGRGPGGAGGQLPAGGWGAWAGYRRRCWRDRQTAASRGLGAGLHVGSVFSSEHGEKPS